jgi:PAS domain S-box-containing protein
MNVLNNITIRGKLQIGIAMLICILGGLASYLLYTVNNVSSLVDDLQNRAEYIFLINEVNIESLEEVEYFKKYLLENRPDYKIESESSYEIVEEGLEELIVLGTNQVVVSALNEIQDLHRERNDIIVQLVDYYDDPEGNEFILEGLDFWFLISEIDKISGEITFRLDRINEVSDIERLQQAEFLSESTNLNGVTSLAIISIVAMLLIVISYVLMNSISGPLRRLKIAAEEMANGNFDFDIKINSNDEIGVLAASFMTMRERLQDSYITLEQKVKERTKKLNKTVAELNGTKESLIKTLEVLEQKQQSIQKEKSRTEAVLYSIGEGLVFMDTDLEVVFANKAVEDLLGYEAERIVGKKWYDVVRPVHENGEKIEDSELSLYKLLDHKSKEKATTSLSDDHYYLKANGQKLPVSVIASKVITEGELTGLILVFKDITKDKEVDKAKTEFVSLASHQLRTPLTSISWNTEMLMNGEVGEIDDEQKIYLEEIYYGSKRMINLVNSLLNTSRIDLGNFVVEPEDVDVVEMTKEVVQELDESFRKKNMTLKVNYEDIGVVSLDKKLYHIIVENFLTNAIKYTPEGGDITVELKKVDQSFQYSVSDNGYGIPENQKDKIFEKLFRADNVKVKDTDGTGLGLYLVKSIVDYVGGEIWFESEEGKGTTFFVQLPMTGMKLKDGSRALGEFRKK